MVPAGTTGVIALVIVDDEMVALDAVIPRSPIGDVQAEIAAQEEAARAAEREARKVLRAQHAEARHQKFDARRAAQRQRLRALRDRIKHALTGEQSA